MLPGQEVEIDPDKEIMDSLGDWRDELSTDEDVQPARPKKRATQVSSLSFSVEALMSDRRPLNATHTGKGQDALNNVDNETGGPDDFSQKFVSVKTEPSEHGDSASWISRPMQMSTPPRKCPGVCLTSFIKADLNSALYNRFRQALWGPYRLSH